MTEEIKIDYDAIKEKAESYKDAMTAFLRDLIRLKGESTEEEQKAKRIKEEIFETCIKYGRNYSDIEIVGVTKTVEPERILPIKKRTRKSAILICK